MKASRRGLEGGFKGFDLLELTGEPGGPRHRVLRTEPAAEAPAVVRKIVGDSLTYTETGDWDPETQIWVYEIVTNVASDKVKIGGRLWAEARGDNQRLEQQLRHGRRVE